MKPSVWLGLSALALAFAPTAGATPIIASPTGLAAPLTTVTFDEFGIADGTLITTQYSTLGVEFTGSTAQGTFGTPAFSGGVIFDNGTPFSIHFTTDQNAVAFTLGANFPSQTVEALLNGVSVESFTHDTTFAANGDFFPYYGFTGITFDEIRVSGGGGGGVDNIQMGTATVPDRGSTSILLGLGLLGIFVGKMRRLSVTQVAR
jgi:hypothetical protein